ncbi:hypothetical protein PHYBOEH_009324 [Phytophthora boehmeriae]|uniref:CBM1 domain-containing protein n=1 Tax=Phytophthora boehmeriae TaxID=109152 RepID=A0A8T1VTU7_9STRA|nr:hypothetical protein PHYBOEH_009324 [Phytophthora boehmeriae]
MKIFALTVSAVAFLSSTDAAEQSSVHLRVHTESGCTITNESQCDGQNWSFSTCCADPSYECRWDDYGQNVKRCQKKKHWGHHKSHDKGGCTITNESQCDGQNWSYSTCCADPSYECRWDDYGQNVKRCQKKHWSHHKSHEKGSCTITNESQCNGQNWTGSTCCADPNYECRWSDDGQNVQRCQKKKGGNTGGNPGGNPGGNTGGSGTVADWGDCTGGKSCKTAGSQCVKHSNYYSQCKPKTLPAGELCGQNDGTNVWKYDYCPSNQKCAPLGTDFRCTNKKHHKEAEEEYEEDKYEEYEDGDDYESSDD